MGKKNTNYLSNTYLLSELAISNTVDKPTDNLVRSFILLTERIANMSNFRNYTYIDDMKSEALYRVIVAWKSFDATKSQNPFSYFTQVITMAMIAYIKSEQKHQRLNTAICYEYIPDEDLANYKDVLEGSGAFAEDIKSSSNSEAEEEFIELAKMAIAEGKEDDISQWSEQYGVSASTTNRIISAARGNRRRSKARMGRNISL